MFCFGSFPTKLKNAYIRPIFKTGEKDEMKNYRPISLLTGISKVFEYVIHIRLTNFLERNAVLSDQQYGFRKGMSTIRGLYQALSFAIDSLNNKNQTLVMCLDLSRAFDSVDHNILLNRLDGYGIRGRALELMKSYLCGRTQQVIDFDLNGRKIVSNKVIIEKGVPQGSILGPLLYILYTNEVPHIIQEQTVLYADDTTVLFSASDVLSLSTRVPLAVSDLSKYFHSIGLSLNISKTQCMLFSNRYSIPFILQHEQQEICSVNSVSFLGLTIDRRLDWLHHIEVLASKTSQFCYALRVISGSVGIDAAMSAYYAFIYSRFKYGIIFWGNSTGVEGILRIQKKCLRSIFGLSQQESCREIFVEHNVLTVVSMYILEAVVFVLENWNLFGHRRLEHEYDTRHRLQLVSDKYNFSYLQKNIDYSLIKIFNSLPENFTLSMPKNKVKKCLNIFLCRGAFYSLAEFLNSDKSALCHI